MNIRNLFFSILIVLTCNMTLPEYAEQFLIQHPLIQAEKEGVHYSEARLKLTTEQDSLDLLLAPTVKRDLSIATDDFSGQSWGESASLTQTLKNYDSFGLKQNYLTTQLDNGEKFSSDHSWSLFYNIEFGQASRPNIQKIAITEDELRLKKSQIEFVDTFNKLCVDASKRYVNYFVSLERKKVAEDVLKSSQKILDIAQQNWKKRMIRKIDLLSAQTNVLRVHKQLDEIHYDEKVDLIKLHQYLAPEKNIEIEAPDSIMNALLSIVWPQKSLEMDKKKYDLQIAKSQLQEAESVDGSKFLASIEAGQAQNDIPLTNSDFNNSQDRFVSLSMSWQLPIESSQIQYQKILMHSSLQKLRFQLNHLQESYQVTLKSFSKNKDKILSQLKFAQSLSQEYLIQIRESEKLYRSGDIEAEEFIRLKDRHLENELEVQMIKKVLWNLALDQLEISGSQDSFCHQLMNKVSNEDLNSSLSRL